MSTRAFMYPVTDHDKIAHVSQIVNRAYGVPPHTSHLPVDNPVSLDRTNMNRLQDSEYMVAFKADGIRYVLVLCMYRSRPLACMVDRSGAMFSLHILAQATHFQNTSVFDGELCACTTGQNVYDFLVFNALIDQGAILYNKSYTTRLTHVRNNYAPHPVASQERSRFRMYIFARSPRLNMVRKEYDRAENMRAMLHSLTPRYKYDGFVFTPAQDPVRPGRNEALLKFKTDNPIDVLMILETNGCMNLLVDDNGTNVPLESVVDTPINFESTPEFEEMCHDSEIYRQTFDVGCFCQVVELSCTVRHSRLILRYVRLRPDKDGPNNVVTVQRTIQTIRDNIALDEIYVLLAPKPKNEPWPVVE